MRSPYVRRDDRSLNLARAIALLVPVAALGGALAFQYIGGLSPCEMCMWQRWPHLAGMILAVAAIITRKNSGTSIALTLLAALAILVSGAIGAFHAGVEYHWWQGLTTCTAPIGGQGGISALDAIMHAPLVRCDTPAWTMFGISMAGYNAILSVGSAIAIGLLIRRWRAGL